ncbi:folate-binding protein [Neisseria sp. N95_16]|uniref:Folate-binding protein n=1 Tax=Neisseria brasiliensis TaxID=2666100 RepID=A0A5Q3S814_9NEIS|nr:MULTISPECIES: folate-binding protein YgfZ [Neisseria]MRN39230.1 folate-binding protein [Neisseria brasiliensis]PJO08766.1 folate-binding protein [Neisseria sp. N95_16]PJO78826.1 folate-binding protein [Neisseria sp. N177_16]QGL26218.1 folate-binding protein [Neisseria brasiliensis]
MQTRLPFFGVVRVSGDDRADFLHNQLSNDIQNLATGQACYATYNTAKGRVLANMIVLNRGDDLLLVMAQDLIEPIIKKLRMYVLRAKVVFEPLADFAVVGELADDAKAVIAAEPSLAFAAENQNDVWCIHLPHTGRLKVGLAEQLPPHDAAAENAWNLHEICSGYAWISAATKETAVAQMLNQHIIGGVHFRKGCYPGQEIIARAQYRGQVKRGLAVLSGNSLEAAGIAVQVGGEEAGQIINTAFTDNGSLSLAVIKFSAADAALTDADGNALAVEQLFFTVEPKE